ncbi:thymidylate synthase [Spiroplasma sp. TIUS-1]|uniref:thymidylate synthase n=1 Tax=Spiroplasma sp. TIUS-1 TaxID=216963 RepID=UPI0013981335|nr:thymidylate synthase [Spiroplasma sp. TIUS-1]QHX35987.1 thymidylate synthase [Spiroplasma sp. TIUS-1]
MKEYLKVLKEVLEQGSMQVDRTGIGTISKFGMQSRYDLREGFPMVTTKKLFFKAVVHEIIWFISGSTNIKYLVDNGVRIWNEWPYANFKKSKEFKNETIEQFVEKIKSDDAFAAIWGELGPVYGKQWRNFGGVDQLKNVVNQIKTNPSSRRLIVSSWNPTEIEDMLLPPCHSLYQFKVDGNFLDLQLYQRSADLFLGVPFNIASYALLLTMVANECKLTPRFFIHTLGDAHIYNNLVDQVKLQLTRKPMKLCEISINMTGKSIFDVKYEDVKLIDYISHPAIKGEVAV